MADPTFDDLIPAQQSAPQAAQAPQAPAQPAPVTFDDLIPGQGPQAQAAPAQPAQQPNGAVYFSNGETITPPQQATWTTLLNKRALDLNKPMGDALRPYARRQGETPAPGDTYIDYDGSIKTAPTPSIMADADPRTATVQPLGASSATPQPNSGGPIDTLAAYEKPVLAFNDELGHVLDTGVRTLARGVPIVGPLAKYGNAALDATGAKIGHWLNPGASTIDGLNVESPVTINGQHPGVSWGGLFDQALAGQNARDAKFDTNHPVLSAAGQGAGTVAGLMADPLGALSPVSTVAKPVGLVARTLAGAGDGALVFGPDGYLRGNGDWNDPSRVKGALAEGGFGALGGAASPLVFAGGEGALNAGRNLFNQGAPVGNGTVDDLVTMLRGGGSPSAPAPGQLDLAQALQAHAPEGTVKPGDMSGAVARIGRAAQRSGQPLDQILSQVSAMGPNAMLADAPGMVDLAKATADRPSTGQQILEQNLTARQQGVRDPSTGLWDPAQPPASTRIANAMAEGMGLGDRTALSEATNLVDAQRAAAGPAYDKAYAHPPVSRESFGTFQGPMFDDMYQRARTISQKEFVTMPDGSERIIPLPARIPDQLDWRTLDLMKQGADDMVGEGKRAGIGANDQNATSGFRDRFRQRLDDLNGDYATARQAYAKPAAILDAINDGKSFMSDNPETNAATFAKLSRSEQEGFRLGAWQAARDRLGNTDVTRNAAQAAGVLKTDQMARLQTLFPDQGAFADFSTKLQNENAFTNTRNTVLSGSRTSRNLGAAEDAADNPLETGMHVIGAAHGNHESWLSLVAKALPKPGQMSEGTANALGSILGTPGAAQDPTIRELLQSAWQANAAKTAASAVATKAGTAAGAATGQAAAAAMAAKRAGAAASSN